MSNGSGEPTSNQSFAELVGQSGTYSPQQEPEKRVVELVGRVFRADDPSMFTMALASEGRGPGRAIEAKVADVLHHEVAFEDSAGRKTLKVRLPEDAPVKMLVSAADLLASPTAPPVSKQDVKPDPIKHQDPKHFDPKQFDPKHDPKHVDPKQFDPKPDPKPDPIKQDPGPIEGNLTGQSMTPFVLAAPKQQDPIKQQDPKHDPKQDPIKQFDPIKQQDPKHDPKQDPIKQFDPIKQQDPKHDPKQDPIKQFDPIKQQDPKHDP